MGIFDKIKEAIFGHAANAAEPATGAASPTPVPGTAAPVPTSTAAPTASAPAPTSTPSAGTHPAGNASHAQVDVAAILDKAVAANGQKLDWRKSIVDLMKALGMDASLAERKELAEELHYTGDANDSAKMNMFLHKALLQKLAENGGKVPADLTD